jgi:hypothetical protein
MDKETYRVQLNTTASPWMPQQFYAATATFFALNQIRIITIEAVNEGVTGGGVNPDGTYWGSPFTQWGLTNAEIGATFKDGTIMWKVVDVASMEPGPPILIPGRNGGPGSYVQSTSVGGTPVAFFNYIPPTYFEPVIHKHWDVFEHYWQEILRYISRLYAVQIIFNAEILLAGQGVVPEYTMGGIPQYSNFPGHAFKEVKKEIAEIADHLGIQPVTMKNARLQLPNMVYISNPNMPRPGQRGQGERGGKYSNL